MKKILIGIILIVGIGVFIFFVLKQKNTEQIPPDLNPSSEAKIRSSIYGSWEWIQTIDHTGSIVTPKVPNQFVLTITPEGRVTSTTDCNSVNGSIVINEEVISVGPLTATEKACEGEILETLYTNDFARATSYTIQDGLLRITLLKDAGIMTFKQFQVIEE